MKILIVSLLTFGYICASSFTHIGKICGIHRKVGESIWNYDQRVFDNCTDEYYATRKFDYKAIGMLCGVHHSKGSARNFFEKRVYESSECLHKGFGLSREKGELYNDYVDRVNARSNMINQDYRAHFDDEDKDEDKERTIIVEKSIELMGKVDKVSAKIARKIATSMKIIDKWDAKHKASQKRANEEYMKREKAIQEINKKIK